MGRRTEGVEKLKSEFTSLSSSLSLFLLTLGGKGKGKGEGERGGGGRGGENLRANGTEEHIPLNQPTRDLKSGRRKEIKPGRRAEALRRSKAGKKGGGEFTNIGRFSKGFFFSIGIIYLLKKGRRRRKRREKAMVRSRTAVKVPTMHPLPVMNPN